MQPQSRISIRLDEKTSGKTWQEKKRQVSDAFNAIAADLRGHGVSVIETLWLTQEILALAPDENILPLSAEIGKKGFSVRLEPLSHKIQAE